MSSGCGNSDCDREKLLRSMKGFSRNVYCLRRLASAGLLAAKVHTRATNTPAFVRIRRGKAKELRANTRRARLNEDGVFKGGELGRVRVARCHQVHQKVSM